MRLVPPDFSERYLDLRLLRELELESFVVEYKKILKAADMLLYEDFLGGRNITRLVKIRAWVVEQLILGLWQSCVVSSSLALVAVGGFGRGDLQPHSDVDLLILYQGELNDEAIRFFIQCLWDLGLDIGHSVRTVDECRKLASRDVTVATNLLEGRFISGNIRLYEKMYHGIHADEIWTGKSFFQAKYSEQKLRHQKCGGTAYHLEPNIKDGPGGLRDIHMVTWVAQRHFKVTSMHGLVDVGFLHPDEYINLQKGRRYLWKIRFALHHLAGRKEDRLLFDYQKPIAEIFGYVDDSRRLGVERFMQDYYRNAMQLERLNLRLLQLFHENILYVDLPKKVISLSPRFRAVNNYIEICSAELFHSEPSVFFELFQLLQEHDWLEGIRADTVRALRQSLHLVDHEFRDSPVIKEQFIDIFKQTKGVFKQLMRMNRLGLLGQYLPVFGEVVGLMQYDLFHMYTVDQHSLFVLRNMRHIAQNAKQHPLAHSVLRKFNNTYVLYLSALFHDIAKGRGGDHSDLGAIDAMNFAIEHNLPKEDAELLSWLVKNHLIMSVVAQKQDISDEKIIRNFTEIIKNKKHLDALYVLTIADISATDPKLWNAFKDGLLRELYRRTCSELENDSINRLEKKKELAKRNLTDIPDQVIEDFWRTTDERFFDHSSISQINQIITQATKHPDKASVLISDRHDDGFAMIVYVDDYRGLFSQVMHVLTNHQIRVADARIYNTMDGKALDYFHCLGHYNEHILNTLTDSLLSVLKSQNFDNILNHYLQDIRQKHFIIEPKVKFFIGRNDKETKMELICSDRFGLLAWMAKLLLEMNIDIHGARIATFGNRVEDVFWLSKNSCVLSTKTQKKLKEKIIYELDQVMN